MCRLVQVKKFLFLVLIFISCVSNDCGNIVDKYESNGLYFFTLTGGYANSSNNSQFGRGGQAEVTKEVYDSFNLGEEYCID